MDLVNLFDLEAQYATVTEMKKEAMQQHNSLLSGPNIVGSQIEETSDKKLKRKQLNDTSKTLDELSRQQEELYNEMYKFFTDNANNITDFVEFQNFLHSEGSLIHFVASNPNKKTLGGLKISNNRKYILRFVVTDAESFPLFLECSIDENIRRLEDTGVLIVDNEDEFKQTLENFYNGSDVVNSLNDY